MTIHPIGDLGAPSFFKWDFRGKIKSSKSYFCEKFIFVNILLVNDHIQMWKKVCWFKTCNKPFKSFFLAETILSFRDGSLK